MNIYYIIALVLGLPGLYFALTGFIKRVAKREAIYSAITKANYWATRALENKFWRIVAGLEEPDSTEFGLFASHMKQAIDGASAKLKLNEKTTLDSEFIKDLGVAIADRFVPLMQDQSVRMGRKPYNWPKLQLRWFLWVEEYGQTLAARSVTIRGFSGELVRKTAILKAEGLTAVMHQLDSQPDFSAIPQEYWEEPMNLWHQFVSKPLGWEIESAHRALERLRQFSGDADVAMLIARYEGVLKSASAKVESGAFETLETQANELLRNLEKAESIRLAQGAFSDLAHTYRANEEALRETNELK